MAKKKTAAPKTHFVVSRVNWRVAGRERTRIRLAGETRVAAFEDYDSAEADRASREAAARKLVNPFRCGATWLDRSSLPEAVFRDFIADAGIEPPTLVPLPGLGANGKPLSFYERQQLRKEPLPAGSFRDWADWWDARAASLSAEQAVRVWEGLDRVRFFRVDERPARKVAYVIVEVQWNYNDEWYYPPAEGGAPHTAYRSRAKAEAECARMNADAREQWRSHSSLPEPGERPTDMDGFEAFPFDMQNRVFPGDDPFAPRRTVPERPWDNEQGYDQGKFAVDEVPFYEVIEFELSEDQ
jgi:hypothetical protein